MNAPRPFAVGRETYPPHATAPQSAVPRQVVLLGAGGVLRVPDQAGEDAEQQIALTVLDGRVRALDWNLRMYEQAGVGGVRYVAGFRAQDVIRSYPRLEIVVNPAWRNTHTLGSLAVVAPLREHDTVIQYADTVFRPEVLADLCQQNGDVVCAIDSSWRGRIAEPAVRARAEKVIVSDTLILRCGRTSVSETEATAQLTGLVVLRGRAIPIVNALYDEPSTDRPFYDASSLLHGSLTDLLHYLLDRGLEIRALDCANRWAELDTPHDLTHFVLGTKAQTLDRLSSLLRESIVDPYQIVDVDAWQTNRARIVAKIQGALSPQPVIVRSSALAEDGWAASNAGAFTSVPNVDLADPAALENAIDEVIASLPPNAGNQVLVQRQVTNAVLSGVAFTRSSQSGAPYYVVNYSDQEGVTDAVTSGRAADLRTVVTLRSYASTSSHPLFRHLAPALAEVERLVGHDALDIEFALDSDSCVHLLQVRPLVGSLEGRSVLDHQIEDEVCGAHRLLPYRLGRNPLLPGGRSILADMTDWNPAEIIGVTPSQLAASLYRLILTDDIWAASRAHLGYHDVRPFPLMVSVVGRPYVDVRTSFASFLPADLPAALKEKLVDYYIGRLGERPELHDKAEFEIVFTCLTFDFDEQSHRLRENGFDAYEIAELRSALMRLTNRVIGLRGDGLDQDLPDLATLNERRERLMSAAGSGSDALLGQIHFLIHDLRRFGTLQFANLARGAFVAVAMLRSLVTVGVLTELELEGFLSSVETVAGGLARDVERLHACEIGLEEFLSRYGHLRPGTYELRVPSYDEAPDTYFPAFAGTAPPLVSRSGRFELSADTAERIQTALADAGIRVGATDFLGFCRKTIAGRELSKFEFTKNLSLALTQLKALAAELGLSVDEISCLRLEDLLALHGTGVMLTDVEKLRELARFHAIQQRITESVLLPHVIAHPDDLYCFEAPPSRPTFITHKIITAPVAAVGYSQQHGPPAGCIAMITNADPGYDWLFAQNIVGLITVHGGSNSHMAIRCFEFGLPAAIGVGDSLASLIAGASLVQLDCMQQRVSRIY